MVFGQRDGDLVVGFDVLAELVPDDDGVLAVLVAQLQNLGAEPAVAPGPVDACALEPGRKRRLIHAEPRAALAQVRAGAYRADQFHPPLRILGAVFPPVLKDLGVLDEEDVAVLLVMGIGAVLAAVEVRPPERLALPPVIADRRRQHRDRLAVVLGQSDAGTRQFGQRHFQRVQVGQGHFQRVQFSGSRPGARADVYRLERGRGRAGACDRDAASRLDPALLCQAQEPVPELQCGEAVVFVVVGDPCEDGGRFLGPLIVTCVAVVGVGNHGGAGVLHIPGAQIRPHVEWLKFLDAVGVLGDPDAVPDGLVQVHQEPVAQPAVHGVFAGNVHDGEFPERRLLIGGVVVDVHVRVVLPPFLHVVEEIEEGLLLRFPAVRPERPENPGDTGSRRCFDDAEQVLQSPDSGGLFLPQRIALEVEEDVAVARRGKLGQRVFRNDSEADGVLLAVLDVPDAAVAPPMPLCIRACACRRRSAAFAFGRLARAKSLTE